MNEETEDEMDEENEEDGETKEEEYEEPKLLLLILEEAKRSTSKMHHFVAHDVDQRWLRNVEDHAYKIFSQMRNIVESTGRVKKYHDAYTPKVDEDTRSVPESVRIEVL